MSDYFVPTKRIHVIVTNQHYDIKRTEPGFEGLDDLDAVQNDSEAVKKGLQDLGASALEIHRHHDVKLEDMRGIFKDLDLNCKVNSKA